MSWLRLAWAVAGKDLRIEFRSRDLFSSMFLFAALVLVVFQFAFHFVPPAPSGGGSPGGQELTGRQALFVDFGAGVLWTVFTLAGLLGLSRSFRLERENSCLDGLLLAPADRSVVFVGKLAANLVLVAGMEAMVVLLAALLYQLPILPILPGLALVIAVNTFGFTTLGTVFSLVCSRARGGESLLPILQLPLSLPLLIYAVGATGGILHGATIAEVRSEIGISAGASVVYFALSLLFFDRLIED